MADENPAHVFAFPDFNQSSRWLDLSRSPNDHFFNAKVDDPKRPASGPINTRPAKAEVEGFFKLPTSLDLTNLNGEEPIEHSNAFQPKPLHHVELPDLDIFDEAWFQKNEPPASGAEFKAWDTFSVPDIPHPAPLFVTEAGPAVYDATITSNEDVLNIGNSDHSIIQSNPYLAALLALSLGRGSVLFIWDDKKGTFSPQLDKMRISGYSAEVLHGLQSRCLDCGATTRSLSAYVQLTYQSHPSPVKIALAKSVDVLLLAIQKKLGFRGARVRSLLQLQSLVQPVQDILAYFKSLIAKMSRGKTDEQMLSVIFEETQALEHGDMLLSDVMREVLSRASEPWTDFAEKWIGLKAEEGIRLTKTEPGKSFVKVENIAIMDDFGFETEEPDFVLDEAHMPGFVPAEISLVLFEAGRNLRLLRTHHPEHPLAHMETISSSVPPKLQWHFDWESIGQFQEGVGIYERRVVQKIHPGGKEVGTSPETTGPSVPTVLQGHGLQFFGYEGAQLEGRLLASIKALDHPPVAVAEEDGLSRLLETRLFEDDCMSEQAAASFSPHWSLIPFHSFGPLVAAQARMINREYMKLLFTSHELREHLNIQKHFQLLGNGVFCSRLAHALFDLDLESAERQAGVARNGGVMGLRLSGRETWPPASSELRLALMGVLTDSYLPASSLGISRPGVEDQKLPGDLSFAVRDLSPDEIDKCLDPSSLEALDFLRLAYKPPTPLSPVLPPVVLVKYDKIFKLLLRVLRMLYVVGQLCRDTSARVTREPDIGNTWLRFRFEAQHFVSSISTYFFDTGIEMPWRRFEAWLEGVESDLLRDSVGPGEARVLSPDELREEHERVLDRMMHTLLLRKRQQPVLKLLEDIFTVILRFSERARLEASGKVAEEAGGAYLQGLYATFKKKVGVFMTVCRGLSEKGGNTSKSTKFDSTQVDSRRGEGIKEENTIDRLLIKLEMSGYYAH